MLLPCLTSQEFEAVIQFVRIRLIAFTQSAPRAPVGSLGAGLSPTSAVVVTTKIISTHHENFGIQITS